MDDVTLADRHRLALERLDRLVDTLQEHHDRQRASEWPAWFPDRLHYTEGALAAARKAREVVDLDYVAWLASKRGVAHAYRGVDGTALCGRQANEAIRNDVRDRCKRCTAKATDVMGR